MASSMLVGNKVINVPDMVNVDLQYLNIKHSSTHSTQTITLRFIYKLRYDSLN